jgi:hypothetical protein
VTNEGAELKTPSLMDHVIHLQLRVFGRALPLQIPFPKPIFFLFLRSSTPSASAVLEKERKGLLMR